MIYEIQLFCLGITFASLVFITCINIINYKYNLTETKPKFAYVVFIDRNNKQTIEKVKLDEFTYYKTFNSKQGICYILQE